MKVKLREDCKDLPLPSYQTLFSSGVDLYAAVREPVNVEPMAWVPIPTGIYIELPPGYEAQVRPRSGLALRYGVTVLNSPGTIDADYRGEVVVILVNFGKSTFTIRRGDRIAQLVITPVARVKFELVSELSETERADGGFGSTGI